MGFRLRVRHGRLGITVRTRKENKTDGKGRGKGCGGCVSTFNFRSKRLRPSVYNFNLYLTFTRSTSLYCLETRVPDYSVGVVKKDEDCYTILTHRLSGYGLLSLSRVSTFFSLYVSVDQCPNEWIGPVGNCMTTVFSRIFHHPFSLPYLSPYRDLPNPGTKILKRRQGRTTSFVILCTGIISKSVLRGGKEDK